MTLDEILSEIMCSIPTGPGKTIATPDTSLWTDLDLDSLEMLELIDHVERRYQVNLFSTGIDLRYIETPRKLAEHVLERKKANQ